MFSNKNMFIAEVRNVKDDKWKSGRVQIRVYGKHDDEQNIKDEHLHWAMPLQPITSAATNRIGTSPTGMVVGSRVIGFFLDDAQQYPVIVGTFARAGKQKQDDDNTDGFDSIDAKYSDVPKAARIANNTLSQSNTLSKDARTDPTETSEYNKKKHSSDDDGKDGTKEAKKKYAKDNGDKPTTASLDKTDTSSILQKILKVDSDNQSGALPKAPENFKKILEMSNMSNMSGINGMAGGALGNVLQQMGGNIGIGNLLGQLTSMFNGGGGGSGSNGQGQGQNGNNFQTPQQVADGANALLDQMSGISMSETVEAMSQEDRDALYVALLHLFNNVTADLHVNPIVIRSESGNAVLIQEQFIVDIADVPDGYLEEFSYSDTDPYPGYIKWIGPEGEILFTVRPDDKPYSSTPTEDAINAGILILLEELLHMARTGRLDLNRILELLGLARTAVQNQAIQNMHGNNMQNNNNMMNNLQQLLGQLGGLIQKAKTQHLPESVLDKTKMDKVLENYSKKGADLRKKKTLANQAVQQKKRSAASGSVLG
jgi:hypothetical protein